MKVSDILVKSLEDQGVELVCGVPGEENADFVQSLEKSKKIRFVLTHDETAAGMMALGYAQVSGKIAVCLATLGPGLTNMSTAMGQALQDGAPMIALVGQGSTQRINRDSHQIIDQLAFAEPITKEAISFRNPNTVSHQVRNIHREAISGKPGTVMIELPEDIAKLDGEYVKLEKAEKVNFYTDLREVVKAAAIINESISPVILIGAGVHRESIVEEVRAFVKEMNCEVVNTFQGKGVAGNNTVGFMDGHNKHILDAADVVIAIGFGQVEVAAEKLGLHEGGKRIIHVCIEAHSDDPVYNPEIELIGDMGVSIQSLTEMI